MSMTEIRRSFDDGLERLRWYATVIAERIRIEIAVVRLMRQAEDLERQRTGLLAEVGRRVFELRRSPEINLAEDLRVAEKLKEVEALDTTISELRRRIAEVSAGQPDEG